MAKKGKVRFSKEQAERLLPKMLRHLTLEAIECMMLLDTHKPSSRIIESKLLSLKGYANIITKLGYTIWRETQNEEEAT
ncbi:unnamed protein product [marine sediment metagenome]|uniref:Uncharacterized protein n=1 Tax=marine sediment metagenome TaxID=412755 RepID=X1RDJ1_9ZZZZ